MGGIRRNKKKNPRNRDPKIHSTPFEGGYKDIIRENKLFERFYRAQKICSSEEDFLAMLTALKSDLPASFRVTGFRSQATAVRDIIEGTYFKDLTDKKKTQGDTSSKIVEPQVLEWYGDRMAWQLNVTRKDIRREEAYFKLHNFLVSETESGNISRQETVSMIPPLVLDVKPHHKVLDMCAAPGSKTAQLIEALHAVEEVIPEGFVVANDSENSRCYMLVHQAKRLQSPCVIITNHDAAIMPNLIVTKENGSLSNLKFDRILCDVPCSGDGTMRKNADIWPKWTPSTSNNLHGIQFRIVKRGLELLEIGGRMVYSTCSLNPVEDEGVLHRILRETGDSVEIVDAADLVPGLKFSPGLSVWKLADKEGNLYSNFEEVPETQHNQIRPYMFPPSAEEADKFHLNRAMRVLPHMQNTGGFFVAILEKRKPCPWERKQKYENNTAEEEKRSTEEPKRLRQPPKKKPRRYHGYKEDPFMYFESDDEIFTKIREYYGIEGLNPRMFLTRCKDTTKRNILYFTSLAVRDLVVNNLEKVKIINTGVKAFARCENKGATCDFRLAQEGSLMTIPFIRKRIVRPTKVDLQTLLLSSDIEKPPEISQMDPKTQEQLNALETGSVAFIFEEENDGKKLKVELVGWSGKSSIRAYVPKNERIHYLRLVGGDTSKYEKNKFEARRDAQNIEEEEVHEVKDGTANDDDDNNGEVEEQ